MRTLKTENILHFETSNRRETQRSLPAKVMKEALAGLYSYIFFTKQISGKQKEDQHEVFKCINDDMYILMYTELQLARNTLLRLDVVATVVTDEM